MTKLDIIVPGPEIETDPAATALWDQTGNFIGPALARMERGKAFSIMLGRFQLWLREAYGAENARKVLQALSNPLPALRVPRLPRSRDRSAENFSWRQSETPAARRPKRFLYRLVPAPLPPPWPPPPLGLERTGLVASGCVEPVGPTAPG